MKTRRVRPLTHIEIALWHPEQAIIVQLEAMAEPESEPKSMLLYMTAEQATTVGKTLLEAAEELE